MSGRLRRLFGKQPPPETPPVRYLPLLDSPPVAVAPKPTCEPRPLTSVELMVERCPAFECGLPAVGGTLQWRDLGPHQLLSRRSYRCSAGHGWVYETDGG